MVEEWHCDQVPLEGQGVRCGTWCGDKEERGGGERQAAELLGEGGEIQAAEKSEWTPRDSFAPA